MSGEIEAPKPVWTADTLKVHTHSENAALRGKLKDMRNLLDERYANQARELGHAVKTLDAAMKLARKEDQRSVATALGSVEKSIDKAEAANERRFEEVDKRFNNVYEVRGQLMEQSASFVRRDEFAQAMLRVDEKAASMQEYINQDTGRNRGLNSGWLYLLGISSILGVTAAIISVIIAATRN